MYSDDVLFVVIQIGSPAKDRKPINTIDWIAGPRAATYHRVKKISAMYFNYGIEERSSGNVLGKWYR